MKQWPLPPSTCSREAAEDQTCSEEIQLSPLDMSLHDSELVTHS